MHDYVPNNCVLGHIGSLGIFTLSDKMNSSWVNVMLCLSTSVAFDGSDGIFLWKILHYILVSKYEL
jgi:hypothetical protein